MTSLVMELFKHNLWANLRLFDACEQLDDVQLGRQLLTWPSQRRRL